MWKLSSTFASTVIRVVSSASADTGPRRRTLIPVCAPLGTVNSIVDASSPPETVYWAASFTLADSTTIRS